MDERTQSILARAYELLNQREESEWQHEQWRANRDPNASTWQAPTPEPVKIPNENLRPVTRQAPEAQAAEGWEAWDRWCRAHIEIAIKARDEVLFEAVATFVHAWTDKKLSEQRTEFETKLGQLRADLEILRGIVASKGADIVDIKGAARHAAA